MHCGKELLARKCGNLCAANGCDSEAKDCCWGAIEVEGKKFCWEQCADRHADPETRDEYIPEVVSLRTEWALCFGAEVYVGIARENDPCYDMGQDTLDKEMSSLAGTRAGLEFRLRELGQVI
jgi:hypothetical protein